MKVVYNLAAQLPPDALVGLAGIGEAVAQDDLARHERGLDHFSDRLGTIGEHQTQLSEGSDIIGARVQQQGADAVANPGSPWLAGRRYRKTIRFQPVFQAAKLGAFTGPIQASKVTKRPRGMHGVYNGDCNRLWAFKVFKDTSPPWPDPRSLVPGRRIPDADFAA